jgi:hypothetical protein
MPRDDKAGQALVSIARAKRRRGIGNCEAGLQAAVIKNPAP